MIKDKIYFIIRFLLLYFLFKKSIEKDCDPNTFCHSCTFCGATTNNYSSCFYYNMLCKQSDGSYIYIITKYSPFMKNTLTNLFQSDPDITSFCGQEEYKFENLTNEIIIFNSKDIKFPKDKYVHCHYSLMTKNVVEYEPILYFRLSNNKNSTELRRLKFELTNFYIYSDEDEDIVTVNYSNFSPNNYKKKIQKEKMVEIFLDFMGLNYEQPEAILEIKINFAKIKDPPSSLSAFPSSSSSSFDKATVFGSIGGSLVLICIICFAIFYCTKSKQNSEVVGVIYATNV